MATKKRSDLEKELMTDANIARVIRLLEPAEQGVKPISKKDACQILGMAYNTTRLGTVIEEYKQKQERNAKRRADLRGKPLSQEEIKYIIEEYLGGETIESISKSTYRGTTMVKSVLERYHVPIRVPGHSYFRRELVPEGAMRDRFEVGEVVYSAGYDSLARIDMETQDPRYGWIYRVWLLSERQLQSAYQPAYELASLAHLRELGVKV
jgi:hypothetical protein